MMVYNIGLFLTLIVILFLGAMHIGSKLPYRLNRIYQKEPNGIRLFNRFYLSYLMPWILVPFIGSTYFRTYYMIYLLLFTLALEDGLYLHGLYTDRNKEKFLVMAVFNLIIIGIIYILILRYLSDFTPFNLYSIL
ncbi:hypothetical protein [Proteiniclasticum sp.]|uniref:hypothetical protein n=1 Tax=Proteiniclasticum sp. TaxID=2053595 RepID=UPI00289F6B53|nr:hypothetical protein [Proteiniclasticum sp.]